MEKSFVKWASETLHCMQAMGVKDSLVVFGVTKICHICTAGAICHGIFTGHFQLCTKQLYERLCPSVSTCVCLFISPVYHTSLVFSNLPVTVTSLNFHESLPMAKVIYELALLAIYDDQNQERYNFNNTRNIHCRPIHEYFFFGEGFDITSHRKTSWHHVIMERDEKNTFQHNPILELQHQCE